MFYRNSLRACALGVTLLALGACDTVTGVYSVVTGYGQNANQDETVRRPPLTLPPDYNLRPPASAGASGETSPSAAARQAVFGLDREAGNGTVQRRGGLSLGESALLQHAGATRQNPTAVRNRVDSQTQALDQEEQGFAKNLLDPPPPKKEESKGILGTILSTGDKSPTMERKGDNSGVLGGLFDWF